MPANPQHILSVSSSATQTGAGEAAAYPPLPDAEFARRFEESRKTLWAIAVAIVRDHAAAHDVVQEAAVIALQRRSQFDPQTSFGAWVGQIVRFVALNERRKTRRRDPVGDAGAHDGAALPPLDQRQFDQKLLAALDSVSDTARACLIMRVSLDMSYRHIAEALGIPEGTAMSLVHRTRTALRTRLSGLDPGGAP
jgi:RNA polymerase sigma-70 factor (ECF subfamily)